MHAQAKLKFSRPAVGLPKPTQWKHCLVSLPPSYTRPSVEGHYQQNDTGVKGVSKPLAKLSLVAPVVVCTGAFAFAFVAFPARLATAGVGIRPGVVVTRACVWVYDGLTTSCGTPWPVMVHAAHVSSRQVARHPTRPQIEQPSTVHAPNVSVQGSKEPTVVAKIGSPVLSFMACSPWTVASTAVIISAAAGRGRCIRDLVHPLVV